MATETDTFRTGPRRLVTEDKIKKALRSDKGNEAELLSWNIKDFSKIGDNMCSYVTSVQVKYSLHGKESNTSYIVKLNPEYKVSGYDSFTESMFTHEQTFYMKIALEMNSTLESAGLSCLNVAKAFYCSNEKGQEMILMEDLRLRGFVPYGMKENMDDNHTTLVLKSLAKFHASSLLVMKKNPEKDLVSLYSYSSDENMGKQGGLVNSLSRLGYGGLLALSKHVPGYEKAARWLEKAKDTFAMTIDPSSERSPQFDVLCHGDLNPNNLLFRYDEMGKPLEVMLVDLQGNVLSSLTRDLHFFFFLTLTRSIKTLDKVSLLRTYYEEFNAILKAGREVIPFTLEELIEEFRKKQIYGLFVFIIMVPYFASQNFLASPETFFAPKTKEQEDEVAQNLIRMYETCPENVRVIFDVLDDMIEAGVFD